MAQSSFLSSDTNKISFFVFLDRFCNSFQIIKSPCCAGNIYRIENYMVGDSTNCFVPHIGNNSQSQYRYAQVNDLEFCVSLVQKYAYVMKTEFPAEINLMDSMTFIQDAFLTPKPSKATNIDFTEELVYFRFNENKAISEVSKGNVCCVLSEKKDEQGNAYYFVVLINPNEDKNYMNKIDFEHYGWVNKTKLK